MYLTRIGGREILTAGSMRHIYSEGIAYAHLVVMLSSRFLHSCRARAFHGKARMSDSPSYVRLPSALSDRALTVISPPLDDEEIAAHQVEFIKHVFGYCAYLREHSRETPVSDAFLSVFVNLFEVMDANAPDDARRCATQLHGIFRIVIPSFDHDAPPHADIALPPRIDGGDEGMP
jgi:hypothetical protein